MIPNACLMMILDGDTYSPFPKHSRWFLRILALLVSFSPLWALMTDILYDRVQTRTHHSPGLEMLCIGFILVLLRL